MRRRHGNAAARSGAAASESSGQNSEHRNSTPMAQRDQAVRPFSVVIRVFGRLKLWSRFDRRADAEATASPLRVHGFDAVTVDERVQGGAP